MKVAEKIFQTKLLSRLSHRVCRLLFSPDPVLLRKLSILDVSFNTCGALKYTSRSGGGKGREDVGKETGI